MQLISHAPAAARTRTAAVDAAPDRAPSRDRPADRTAALDRTALIGLLPLLGLFLLVALITSPGPSMTGDEGPIIAAAHRLLHGRYAMTGTLDAINYLWHGPGLPAMIAPLVAIGVPLSALRLVSPVLMFAAVLLFYRLLRLRLSPRASVIGAYALGLYAPSYYVLGSIAKDPLALLLSVGALDCTARYLKFGRLHHAVFAGLCLGGLVMTRLEYGWVITAVLIVSVSWWLAAQVRSRWSTQSARRCALICALAMAACVPWLLYTYGLTDRPFYWGDSGGLSLYWMSSPSPTQLGQWYAQHTVMTNHALVAYRPFFHYLNSLSPLQRDLELQHVAVAQALAHPAKYGLNLLANLGRMFAGFPFSFTLPLIVIVPMMLINGALLTGLFAAAASLSRRRARLPSETIPFLLFGAVAFVVHILPSAEPRMVIPIIPIPIWLIAQAWTRRARTRSRDGHATRSGPREAAFAA